MSKCLCYKTEFNIVTKLSFFNYLWINWAASHLENKKELQSVVQNGKHFWKKGTEIRKEQMTPSSFMGIECIYQVANLNSDNQEIPLWLV